VYNIFTPTRNARGLIIHRSDKEHTKNMNELEDIYVEVVRKYTRYGANTFTLMKHKHKGHTHDWRHHYFYNVVSAMTFEMHL